MEEVYGKRLLFTLTAIVIVLVFLASFYDNPTGQAVSSRTDRMDTDAPLNDFFTTTSNTQRSAHRFGTTLMKPLDDGRLKPRTLTPDPLPLDCTCVLGVLHYPGPEPAPRACENFRTGERVDGTKYCVYECNRLSLCLPVTIPPSRPNLPSIVNNGDSYTLKKCTIECPSGTQLIST